MTPPPTTSADLPSPPGYSVAGEIARGGMGRVLAAIDLTLGREVAIKVLLPGGDAARFVNESRITARLSHPGIPPVHAPGVLPDGTPFLVMKLVRGQTLAEILKKRHSASDDLPRLLAVFEQVCQAVGFAHSQGVIHRDIKPANVMVGSFGEVQVMDWGLAKSLTAAEPTDRADYEGWGAEPPADPDATVPQRLGPDSQTVAGVGMGTPAYMPPEQARGEWAAVDRRADVFALGAVLCQILTGQTVYSGRTAEEVVGKAAAGDISEGLARLDACGADGELVPLCKQCLDPDPVRRPAHAGEVAGLVAAYRASVEERLRKAEAQRAAAVATAAEQRKRRKVQLMLAGAVALLVAGTAAAVVWNQRRQAALEAEQARRDGEHKAELARAEAERQFKSQKARESVDAALKLATTLAKQHRFREAGEALQQAHRIAQAEGVDVVKPAIDEVRSNLELVKELDVIRTRKARWVPGPNGEGRFDTDGSAPAYRAALAARGFDLSAGNPSRLASRVVSSPVKAEIVRALDDWAVTEPDEGLRTRVLEVARLADPGPWTDRARNPSVRGDPAELRKLEQAVDPGTLSPAVAAAFAEVMARNRVDPSGWLARAQARYPDDFDIAFALAQWYHNRAAVRAVGYYRAARAAWPENGAALTNLGLLLSNREGAAEAVALLREAVRLDPNDAIAHFNLGVVQHRFGSRDEALAAYRRTVEIDPNHADAFSNLGSLLGTTGDRRGAVEALKQAARLAPRNPDIAGNYGLALQQAGRLDEAVNQFRRAVELAPKDGRSFFNLGMALRQKGNLAQAAKAFAEANRLDPKQFPATPK